MIKVADSNVLQTDQLKNYLLKKNNRIALPDYVSMEAYKGDTLSSIFKSMCILSQHPHQVIILKGTQEICALSGRRSGLRRRMVDPRQTREFYFYCRLLEGAARGDIKTKTRLLNLGRSASEHLERMLTESEGLAEIFREVQGTYSISDLSRFRRGESWSDDFYRAIMANVMLTCTSHSRADAGIV